jgi:hypothetical protein
MDVVSIPSYLQSESTSVSEALANLRQRERGGLVIQDGDACRLLFAGDLLRARAAGVTMVQDVQGGRPVLVLDETHANTRGLDLRSPFNTGAEYQDMLNAGDHDYAVAAPSIRVMPPGTAVVVTRSELFGVSLRMPGGYECNGKPQHSFPEPRVSPGEQCPFYPECERADGTVPTVHPAL